MDSFNTDDMTAGKERKSMLVCLILGLATEVTTKHNYNTNVISSKDKECYQNDIKKLSISLGHAVHDHIVIRTEKNCCGAGYNLQICPKNIRKTFVYYKGILTNFHTELFHPNIT